MTLRLKESEPLEPALRRLARECLDVALESLDEGRDRDVAVHTIRKQGKQIRALLRLFRAGLGEETVREGRFFRDLGRSLSAARDGAVALDVHAGLLEHFGAGIDASVGAGIRQVLIAAMQGSTPRAAGVYGRLPDCDVLRQQLLGARTRCRRWQVAGDSDWILEQGLVRSFRRGRRAVVHVSQGRSARAMHELRKRAKDYWYQLEFVATRWSDLVSRRITAARGLTEVLGDVQDLVIYCAAIETAASDCTPESVEILRALAERRRRVLEKEGLELAQLVFADKPKRFLRELRECDGLRQIAG